MANIKVLLSISVLFLLGSCNVRKTSDLYPDGQGLQVVRYTESGDLFPNPERGFYRYSINTDPLTERKVKQCRDENITLIYRFYYLKDFRNAPLTDALFEQIDDDMEALRKAGGKAIVRFAYSNSGTEPDAPLNVILGHLEQLRPVLNRNKDVIAVLQAGFIGAWGEWHSSTNGLSTDVERNKILEKILEILPANRFVQVRKPSYIRAYVGSQDAVSSEEAFGTTAKARIGLHNDCFLSSINDVGTYSNVEEEKKYLREEGLYVPIGGETCKPRGVEPAACATARPEMRYLRWSYLNRSYYEKTINRWIAQGCLEEFSRYMGYRIVLQEGKFSDKHTPGSALSVSLKLRNVGYAPMFNPRKVELVLRAADGSATYVASLPDDPRRWQPDLEVNLEANVTLPKDIALGNYRLFLSLPDAEPSLHDKSEFSVRFANRYCWEEFTGYNDLGVIIRVENLSQIGKGKSVIRFIKKD